MAAIPWSDALELIAKWGALVLGVYAALLSTFNFFSQRRRDKFDLKVSLGMGFPVYGSQLGATSLVVKAANTGHRTIHLNSFHVMLPNRKQMPLYRIQTHPDLPCKLDPGQSVTGWMNVHEIAETLWEANFRRKVRLVPFGSDQTGAEHRGSSFTFDVPEWKLSLR